jgi:hypothetical protein
VISVNCFNANHANKDEFFQILSVIGNELPASLINSASEAKKNGDESLFFDHFNGLLAQRRLDDILRKYPELQKAVASIFGQHHDYVNHHDLKSNTPNDAHGAGVEDMDLDSIIPLDKNWKYWIELSAKQPRPQQVARMALSNYLLQLDENSALYKKIQEFVGPGIFQKSTGRQSRPPSRTHLVDLDIPISYIPTPYLEGSSGIDLSVAGSVNELPQSMNTLPHVSGSMATQQVPGEKGNRMSVRDTDDDSFEVIEEDLPLDSDDEAILPDENWLLNYLKKNGLAKDEDFEMYSYKGWKIHSPQIQLVRIKNFLCDEDIDRTLDWKSKVTDIAEYLHHLVDSGVDGKEWEYDAWECFKLLHLHSMVERHYYGEQKLTLHFPPLQNASTRLPLQVGAPKLAFERRPELPLKLREPLHRSIGPVNDSKYMMTRRILNAYLTQLQADTKRIWEQPLSMPLPKTWPSRVSTDFPNGFNMVIAEDEVFTFCMNNSPKITETALTVTFDTIAGENNMNISLDGKEITVADKALKSFADFRGAKRAALQFCLTSIDAGENRDVLSPWRRLVLPTETRERNAWRPDAGIIYKPQILKEPPQGLHLETFAFSRWYQVLLHREARSAFEAKMENQIYEKKEIALNYQRSEDGLSIVGRKLQYLPFPPNYCGPYRKKLYKNEGQGYEVYVKRLYHLQRLLEISRRWAPRTFIEDILHYFKLGQEPHAPVPDGVVYTEAEIAANIRGLPHELKREELEWLELLTERSTNANMLRPLSRQGVYFQVFVNRIQTLLNDYHDEGIFAEYSPAVEPEKLLEAINRGCGSNQDYSVHKYAFTMEELERFCTSLACQGRIR